MKILSTTGLGSNFTCSYKKKECSKERGNCWGIISEPLNHLTDTFQSTQMFFQDYCQTWRKTCKKQKQEEDRQRGINPEETDVDIVLADIIEWFEEAQKIHQDPSEKQKKKTEKDAAKAEDMRRKSLETIGEIMKLKSAESDEKQSRCRNTGSETLKFLQEKTVRNCNMVARDWINKGRTYKQTRRSEKSNAL